MPLKWSPFPSSEKSATARRPSAPSHLPPVHFFAEVDVAAGAQQSLRSEALSNRAGKPIDIREIRLNGYIEYQGTFSEIDVGSFLRVNLSVGGKPITNGFIPIWLLGKTEQYFSQVSSGYEANAMYVWRLSKPWHLPPGATVEAAFEHTGGVRFSVLGQIGLAGSYAAERARVTAMPYAAAYVSKAFAYADVDTAESSEKDLANVTPHSVMVERIIGRCGVARTTGTDVGTITDVGDAGPVRLVTMRMATSKNMPIIRDYLAPQAVFGYSRAIEIAHPLAAGDFYRVGVKKIAGPTISTPFKSWSAQMNVSIVGWREEAI